MALSPVCQAFRGFSISSWIAQSLLPNHPRYQLRYTRIFTFRFLEISLSVVKAVVKCNLGVLFYGRSNPEIAHVPRASGVSVLLGSDTGTALPKMSARVIIQQSACLRN